MNTHPPDPAFLPSLSEGVSCGGLDEESAEGFIEDFDLSHGNAEVFIQGDELFFTVEGPENSTMGLAVPLAATHEDLQREFIRHAEDFGAVDEFSQFAGPGSGNTFDYVEKGLSELRERTQRLPEGDQAVDIQDLEQMIAGAGLDEGGHGGDYGGVYDEPGGYQVAMAAPNGLFVHAYVEEGSTASQAREAMIEAVRSKDLDEWFDNAEGEINVGGITSPSELMRRLRSDEKHFHKTAASVRQIMGDSAGHAEKLV